MTTTTSASRPAAFVPAIAAIAVRLIRREGFAESGWRPRIKEAWAIYRLADTLPWVVLATALVVAMAAGKWTLDLGAVWDQRVLLLSAPLICVVSAPLFWGEEYGWTAYLRDRLAPGRPVLTTLGTGLIWGVWHFPLPWVGYFGAARGDWWDAFWAMWLWLPLSVLLEFVIGWLWGESRSVWPPAMLHGGSNLVVAAGIPAIAPALQDPITSTVVMCVALVPVVVVLWAYSWRRSLTAR